ncbi:MAG: HVO_0476 family zinc finger protein [Thermoplasmatota archaeon]
MCPDCGEETLHRVLHGKLGTRGGYTLDATVECSECGRIHPTVVREPGDVTFPVIVSERAESVRTSMTLPAGDILELDDRLVIDGHEVRVTGLETKANRRVESATAEELLTLWTTKHEKLVVKWTINMNKKTISKETIALPTDEFHVGDEQTFGRLRITIHGIKLADKMLRRGSAAAEDIRRIFAKPTRPEHKQFRPEKREREQRAEQSERDIRKARAAYRPPGTERQTAPRGARFGARKAREARARDARKRSS